MGCDKNASRVRSCRPGLSGVIWCHGIQAERRPRRTSPKGTSAMTGQLPVGVLRLRHQPPTPPLFVIRRGDNRDCVSPARLSLVGLVSFPQFDLEDPLPGFPTHHRPPSSKMIARPLSHTLRSRCLLRKPQNVQGFSTRSNLRAADHGDHYDPPAGWLFGVKPGQKYVKEGWEGIWYYGFIGSFLLAGVAYVFKPDTSYASLDLTISRPLDSSWAVPPGTSGNS